MVKINESIRDLPANLEGTRARREKEKKERGEKEKLVNDASWGPRWENK